MTQWDSIPPFRGSLGEMELPAVTPREVAPEIVRLVESMTRSWRWDGLHMEPNDEAFARDVLRESAAQSLMQHHLVEALRYGAAIWHMGDGYGGYVRQLFDALADAMGLPAETRRQRSAPARAPVRHHLARLLVDWDTQCFYCDDPFGDSNPPVVDHYIPRAKGGSDDYDNLRPACAACNTSKRDLMPDEWPGRER